jgi:hypothetical protein
MDPKRQIIEDVIASLKLARTLRHQPLIDSLLSSSSEALESTLVTEARNQPLPRSPVSEPEEPVKSTGTKYRYVNFIADITPYLKTLHPGRNQKINFSEAAKLWKTHKHLDDYETILAVAASAAIDAAKDISPE